MSPARYLIGGNCKPRTFCICGKPKENRRRRYCLECAKWHGYKMHQAHIRKGRGPRKKIA